MNFNLFLTYFLREGYEKKHHIEGDIVSGGCLHMMKLTLMALGGYKYYSEKQHLQQLQQQQNSLIPSTSLSIITSPHYMKFILPTPDSNFLNQSTNSRNTLPQSEFEITVICINFLHIEDVVDLWLDTVRIFSDLAQCKPLEISKNSTFCLKVILFIFVYFF